VVAPSQAEDVAAFDGMRRAQHDGRYAPHKPLLLLAALARVQRGEPPLAPFSVLEPQLAALLDAFGPTGAAARRHLPFWHLGTDRQGALWQVQGPPALLQRPAGATPTIGELRREGVQAGFAPALDAALRHDPALLQQVARHVHEAYSPSSLHGDIAAQAGLHLEPAAPSAHDGEGATASGRRSRREPKFRERVLRACEYRCCVCGLDLRVGYLPAGLEAAHIQWHHVGGPDIEANGLSLCALQHKLFDLGASTVEPSTSRIQFSQHAVGAERGTSGPLAAHRRPILAPQAPDLLPAPRFLAWHRDNPFKRPARAWP
jgi:putative restriction endonuclease